MAAQITAVIIFLVMFAFIITEKIPRHIATTLCQCCNAHSRVWVSVCTVPLRYSRH